jgi:GNAT superfamily N-acetyltransferase
MTHELELTKTNRLKLARAFRHNKRVDCSIDCVIEGQIGRAYVDNFEQPGAYCISVGPFWYFAGESHSMGGQALMKNFPAYNLLMPSPAPWLEVAQEIFGERLKSFPRYSFSAENLSPEQLVGIFESSKHRQNIVPIDANLAERLAALPESYFELSDFDSAQDFAERGFGFAALADDKIMGIAYSSLVYSAGMEVSLYVEEPYRQQGVATALASRLLLESLQNSLRPNWDAANPESCKLAQKLGYAFTESYAAYYYLPE